MPDADNHTPAEADITNGQKMRISNVRVNGDIIGPDGNTVTVGAGLELGAEELARLGAAAVQALADAWTGANGREEG